jgi:hypothetical protein
MVFGIGDGRCEAENGVSFVDKVRVIELLAMLF